MIPFADWLPIQRRLEATLLYNPHDLAEITFADIRINVDSWPGRTLVLSIWRAASIATHPKGSITFPTDDAKCGTGCSDLSR